MMLRSTGYQLSYFSEQYKSPQIEMIDVFA